MQKKMIQTVGIVGLGALGALYANEFYKEMSREDLVIIANEERMARYQKQGLWINEEPSFLPCISQKSRKVDLLIFTTKYPQLEQAIEEARSFCNEDTIILSFLNGVSSEEIIAQKLGKGRLLYSCVQGMDAFRCGNRVRYSQVGYVTFGDQENRLSDDVRKVSNFFDRVKMPYRIPDDIHHQMWSKWMLNVGANQVCAAYEVDYQGVQQQGIYRERMIAAMEEARLCANAEGIHLNREEIQEWIQLIDALPSYAAPSMRQDVLASRPTEVSLFAGKVCELGKKYGIPVPQNQEFLEKLR